MFDSRDNLAALDQREIDYRRVPIALPPADVAVPTAEMETFIYVSTGDQNRWGSAEYPIWRSYVDCVLAGYIDVWGAAGAARFIASTEGWDAPLLDDRANPRYPRAVVLSDAVRVTIDGLLERKRIICTQADRTN